MLMKWFLICGMIGGVISGSSFNSTSPESHHGIDELQEP
jgi:hypothetical protein